MWLGKTANRKDIPFDVKWPQRPIYALGTAFSYNRNLSETLREFHFQNKQIADVGLVNTSKHYRTKPQFECTTFNLFPRNREYNKRDGSSVGSGVSSGVIQLRDKAEKCLSTKIQRPKNDDVKYTYKTVAISNGTNCRILYAHNSENQLRKAANLLLTANKHTENNYQDRLCTRKTSCRYVIPRGHGET